MMFWRQCAAVSTTRGAKYDPEQVWLKIPWGVLITENSITTSLRPPFDVARMISSLFVSMASSSFTSAQAPSASAASTTLHVFRIRMIASFVIPFRAAHRTRRSARAKETKATNDFRRSVNGQDWRWRDTRACPMAMVVVRVDVRTASDRDLDAIAAAVGLDVLIQVATGLAADLEADVELRLPAGLQTGQALALSRRDLFDRCALLRPLVLEDELDVRRHRALALVAHRYDEACPLVDRVTREEQTHGQ